jgi:uncharacterized protein (TIGR03067 family)
MNPSLLLGIVLVVAAPGLKETPKQPPKLEGEWLVESMEGPKGTPPGPVTFRFTENKISVLEGKRDRAEDVGYTVDLTKKPATIDMRPEKGQKELVILGIIEVNGDTMKFCFARDGAGRPSEFKGDDEKGVMMITLKRVKAEK